MARPLQQEYDPNPVPSNLDDIPRFLFEELERIKVALYAQPVAMTVTQTATVTVTTTPNWQRLFNTGDQPSWEVPGGNFNPATGEWTCPQFGLYQHFVDMRIQPYGTGNKSYYAGIRLWRVPADGSPNEVVEAVDSGVDDFELAVTLPGQTVSQSGDIWYCEGTVVHDQFIGDATIDASWQLNRISA